MVATFNWEDFPSPICTSSDYNLSFCPTLNFPETTSCLLYPAVPSKLFHMTSQIAFVFKTVFAGFLWYQTALLSFLPLTISFQSSLQDPLSPPIFQMFLSQSCFHVWEVLFALVSWLSWLIAPKSFSPSKIFFYSPRLLLPNSPLDISKMIRRTL